MTNTTYQKSAQGASTFRNIIFWFLDLLKGAQVRNHYQDIVRINMNHESKYALRKREKYLSEILNHALKTVPYYKNLRLTDTSLHHFPVVDKNLIRQQIDAFHSNEFLGTKTFEATTSGSTGTPFTVLHDMVKKQRHMSDVRFFWDAVHHPWGTKLYYLKVWNSQNRKTVLSNKMQNIVPIDVFKLSDRKIEKLLNAIKSDSKPKSVLSYASALDSIVKYLEQNPTDLSGSGVISIIAMSESLDTVTKNYLENQFGCPVVSRYANLENGMIAQQTSESGNDFLANFASYHIEILDILEDTPAKNGETGRIVVTDLFNRAMPMIRYDTGDLGVLQKSENNGIVHFVLKKVEGRKMDAVYDTSGALISSFMITNSMWKYAELKQYQFIQKGKNRYEFLLNPKGKFVKELELRKEFTDYFGSDASIELNYVDEIPLLSSGKRKKVINTTRVKSKTKKQKSYAI